jgi:predicted Zn-dependent protease with MMP-like domain
MRPHRLQAIAQRVVRATCFQLPTTIRHAMRSCRIEVTWHQATAACGQQAPDPELLGLFTGSSLAEPESSDSLPCIQLFLDNLWDFSRGDLSIFRQQVRITLLHELGHFLGLEEADLTARGLD